MARGKLTSYEIDLSEWSFGYGSEDGNIAKVVTEVLKEVFTSDPPYGIFPYGYEDQPQAIAPLTFEIWLPLAEEDFGPQYQFNLEEAVEQMIEGRQSYKTGIVDGNDDAKLMRDMAAEFRRLADKLEASTVGTNQESVYPSSP